MKDNTRKSHILDAKNGSIEFIESPDRQTVTMRIIEPAPKSSMTEMILTGKELEAIRSLCYSIDVRQYTDEELASLSRVDPAEEPAGPEQLD